METILTDSDGGKLFREYEEVARKNNLNIPTKETIFNTFMYRQLLPHFQLLDIPCPRPDELSDENVKALGGLLSLFLEAMKEVFEEKDVVLITDASMTYMEELFYSFAEFGREEFIDYCLALTGEEAGAERKQQLNNLKRNVLFGELVNKQMPSVTIEVLNNNNQTGGMPHRGALGNGRGNGRGSGRGRGRGASNQLGFVRNRRSLVAPEALQLALAQEGENITGVFEYFKNQNLLNRALDRLLTVLGQRGEEEDKQRLKELFKVYVKQVRDEVERIAVVGAGKMMQYRLAGVRPALTQYVQGLEDKIGRLGRPGEASILNFMDYILPGVVYSKRDALLFVVSLMSLYGAHSSYTRFAGLQYTAAPPPAPQLYTFNRPRFQGQVNLHPILKPTATPLWEYNSATMVLTEAAKNILDNLASAPFITNVRNAAPAPVDTPTEQPGLLSRSVRWVTSWIPDFGTVPTTAQPLPILHHGTRPNALTNSGSTVAATAQKLVFKLGEKLGEKLEQKIVVTADGIASLTGQARLMNPESDFEFLEACPINHRFDPVRQQCVAVTHRAGYIYDSSIMGPTGEIGYYVPVADRQLTEQCYDKGSYTVTGSATTAITAGAAAAGMVGYSTGSKKLAGLTFLGFTVLPVVSRALTCAFPILEDQTGIHGDRAEALAYTLIGAASAVVSVGTAIWGGKRMLQRYTERKAANAKLKAFERVLERIENISETNLFKFIKDDFKRYIEITMADKSRPELLQIYIDNNLYNAEKLRTFQEDKEGLDRAIMEAMRNRNQKAVENLKLTRERLITKFIYEGVLPRIFDVYFTQLKQQYEATFRENGQNVAGITLLAGRVKNAIEADDVLLSEIKKILIDLELSDIRLQQVQAFRQLTETETARASGAITVFRPLPSNAAAAAAGGRPSSVVPTGGAGANVQNGSGLDVVLGGGGGGGGGAAAAAVEELNENENAGNAAVEELNENALNAAARAALGIGGKRRNKKRYTMKRMKKRKGTRKH